MSKFIPPYNITDKAVVMVYDGKTLTVNSGDDRYTAVRDAIRAEEFDAIPNLLDLKGRLISESNGGLYLLNGMLRCDKYDIPAFLATRIIEMFRQGFSIKPLTLFLENLMENPNESGTIVEELYGFIEHCNLPLTQDGCFLAYKKVRSNFRDLWTGKMDNSVGTIVQMPREKCDFDRGRTCSTGLHFCSEHYMEGGNYGTSSSNQVVVLKINPRDVTSIPDEYKDAKGRACRYEIVDAIGWDDTIAPLFTNDHSEEVEDGRSDGETTVPVDAPWELRNTVDGTLVKAYATRQGARLCRSGDKGLYIFYTKTNEVVAGIGYDPAEEVEVEVVVESTVKVNPSAVLTEQNVREIRKTLKTGAFDSIDSLALMYGVSERSIRRIRDGESWKHIVV